MSAVFIPFSGLKLADVVVLEALNAYHTATVSKVIPETMDRPASVTFFRPYVQTADFSMGASGVICYIGIEEWDVYERRGELFKVVERKELK